MHQYKTITQILLALSVLNSVFAAPTVLREARDTSNDLATVADDVTAAGDSPPHGSRPLYNPALFQGSASSKPAPLSPVSATDGEMVRVDATSAHPLLTTDGIRKLCKAR